MLCSLLYIVLHGDNKKSKRNHFPIGEQFIRNHLLKGDGMIRTNFSNTDEGNLYLSESNGLWLNYLASVNDEAAFQTAYTDTKKHLQSKEMLFAWRDNDDEKATTNALIDDLRIIRALYTMGEQTKNQKWVKEANAISEKIIEHHGKDEYLMDFYDWKHQQQSHDLTLSYLDLGTIEKIVQQNIWEKEAYESLKHFVDDLPMDKGWYPFNYSIHEETFHFMEEINLIDQLYIAIHKEEVALNTDAFYKTFMSLYEQDGKLYGRYDFETKQPAVSYESVAVYALAAIYVHQRDDIELSNELLEQMHSFQVTQEENLYIGGYMDEGTNMTHSFDNLLALLAEEGVTDDEFVE